MSNEKPSFPLQLMLVLRRPRDAFRTIEEDDVYKGISVMVAVALLAAFSSSLYIDKLPLSLLSPQVDAVVPTQLDEIIGVITGVSSGVTIMIGWIVSTLLIHGLCKLGGGKGTMKRFFALHGYASVPALIKQALRVADALITDASGISGYFIAYRDIESKMLKSLIAANLVNIWGLFTLALLVIAVEDNYGLSRGKAIMAALAPSLIYFLVNYFMG